MSGRRRHLNYLKKSKPVRDNCYDDEECFINFAFGAFVRSLQEVSPTIVADVELYISDGLHLQIIHLTWSIYFVMSIIEEIERKSTCC